MIFCGYLRSLSPKFSPLEQERTIFDSSNQPNGKTQSRSTSGGQGYTLCVLLILAATLLQKVAVPGTGGALSITTVILPLLAFIAWCRSVLIIDIYAFFGLVAFLTSSSISLYLNGSVNKISLSSVALFTFVQSSLIFRRLPYDTGFIKATSFYRDWMFILSMGGILQYTIQYVVPSSIAFPIDHYLPDELKVTVYNNLNPLFYGSEIIKTNGIFFAEPSFFSQFVGIALIYELATTQRMIRIFVFLTALLCSFSGTGIILVAFFGTYQVLKRLKFEVVVAGVALALIVGVLGSMLQINALTERVNEFSTPNSSGHARFISIFGLLDAVTFTNLTLAFFGTGPGTISSYFLYLPYLVFDPTWGKILFEYGIIGLLCYLYYFFVGIRGRENAVRGPLVMSFFLLGGYFLDGTILTLVAVLLVFQNPPKVYLVTKSRADRAM